MHGTLFNNGGNTGGDDQAEENGDDVSSVIPSTYDRKTSSMWLMKGNISPQQEDMLTKLQDRNLHFGGTSKRCPHCSRGSKSVEHLATHCGGMLELYYKKRHDEVVRCIHFMYAK